MTQPGALGNLVPAGEDWIGRRLRDIERDLSALRSARGLESATIGRGGLTVKDSGTIRVRGEDGSSLRIGQDTYTWAGGATAQGASLSFLEDGKTDPAQIIFIPGTNSGPDGASRALYVRAPDSADGVQTQVTLDNGNFNMIAAGGTAYASLQGRVDEGQGYASIDTETCSLSVIPDGITVGQFEHAGKWGVPAGTVEWQAKDGTTNGYIPVRASSFPTGSSADVKDIVGPVPFDSVEAIKSAPAKAWRYKPSYSVDGLDHVGPIAEDLPAALVHDDPDGVKSVDLLSLIGTLWDAVGKLTARVEALESAGGSSV